MSYSIEYVQAMLSEENNSYELQFETAYIQFCSSTNKPPVAAFLIWEKKMREWKLVLIML